MLNTFLLTWYWNKSINFTHSHSLLLQGDTEEIPVLLYLEEGKNTFPSSFYFEFTTESEGILELK